MNYNSNTRILNECSNSRIRFLIRVFVPLFVLSFGFYAPSNAARTGTTDDPMTIGGGARPLGMGRAFVAIADDADAPFINPAGTAGISGPQLMTMFTNLMGEVYYIELSGSVPSRIGTLGFGYITTGVNQVWTPLDGGGTVLSDYYDNLLLATYSTPLARFFDYGRNIYIGANAKVFLRGWMGGVNESAIGYSADFGVKFIATPNLSFGFCRQNLIPVGIGGVLRWVSGAEEAIAGIYKAGIAVKPKQAGGALLIAADVDLPAQSGRPFTAHLGTEWKLNKLLTIRGGADQSVDSSSSTKTCWNPTFGISLGLAGFRADYAYHAYYNDPMYATHYVSFSFTGAPRFALTGETQ